MCCAGRQQDATTELEDNMGYKILDVKEDIKEAMGKYFSDMEHPVGDFRCTVSLDDLCDIVDEQFKKIER